MKRNPPPQITFRVGQIVAWKYAPLGIAQIEELRRTCVRLYYKCKTGRICRPVVAAAEIARLLGDQAEPVLPLSNPLGRGILPREKTYDLK